MVSEKRAASSSEPSTSKRASLSGPVRKRLIYSIKMHNFLNYSDVKVKPGKKLNLIVGRNGAGKSTIVCAICIGLAGNFKSLGRGNNLVDFVKTGQQSAKVTMDLRHEDFGKADRILIERVINRNEKGANSSWKLNGRNTNQADIEELVNSLHVQTDNLCHFLPQNRVKDFGLLARNGEKLLMETELAVGYPGMDEHHKRLIELTKAVSTVEVDMDALKKQREDKQVRLERLEREMERYRRRQELEKEVDLIEKKLPWVKAIDEERKRDAQKDVLEAAKKELEEAEAKYRAAAAPIRELEKQKDTLDAQLQHATEDTRRARDAVTAYNKKLEHDETEVQIARMKKEEFEKTQRKLRSQIKELSDKVTNDKRTLAEMPSVDLTVKKRLDTEFYNVRGQIDEAQTELDDHKATVSTQKQTLQRKEAEIAKLKNIKDKRAQLLRNSDRDTMEAYGIVQQNASRFRAAVYGPIALELNVKGGDAICAFTESAIAKRIRMSFVVEHEADKEELLRLVKEKMGDKVRFINVVVVSNKPLPQPPNVAHYKSAGVCGWLWDHLDAPKPVLQVIESFSRFSQHFIIDAGADESKALGMGLISLFQNQGGTLLQYYRKSKGSMFTDSTRSVKPAEMLKNSNEHNVQEALQAEVDSLKAQMAALDAKTQDLEKVKREREKKLESINQEKKKITDATSQVKGLTRTIEVNEGKLKDLNNQMKMESVEKLEQGLDKTMKKVCDTVKQLPGFINQHLKCEQQRHIIILTRFVLSRRLDREQEALVELERGVAAARRRCNDEKETLMALKARAKQLVGIALRMTGDLTLPENAALKEALDNLPGTIMELESRKSDLIAQIKSIHEAQDKKNEYELLRTELAAIEARLAATTEALSSNEHEIGIIKSQWLPALKRIVNQINATFSEILSHLKIPGDVILLEHEKDFSQFKLEIRVKFRDADSLNRLDGTRHSGGETSLTTMVYLIALQKLSECPFRVVDEINQGMDAINERLVFERIVEHCCADTSCQTFLITPKLQSNLLTQVTQAITVLCVHSGPGMYDDAEAKKVQI